MANRYLAKYCTIFCCYPWPQTVATTLFFLMDTSVAIAFIFTSSGLVAILYLDTRRCGI